MERRQVLGRLQLAIAAQLGIVAGAESGDEVPRVGEAEIALGGQRPPGRGAVVGEHPQLPRYLGSADRLTSLSVLGERYWSDHGPIVVAVVRGQLVQDGVGDSGRQALHRADQSGEAVGAPSAAGSWAAGGAKRLLASPKLAGLPISRTNRAVLRSQ